MHKLHLDQAFIARVLEISRSAGAAILDIYQRPQAAAIETKADGSPVTQADFAAHSLIVAALHQLLPIPIISEEADLPEATERHSWPHYWLVDPLDGTKEFIAGNGEFTVNIALVARSVPLLGVVHVPVSDETYLGLVVDDQNLAGFTSDVARRAEKYLAGKKIADLHSSSAEARLAAGLALRVLVSHRRAGPETHNLLQHLQQQWPVSLEFLTLGSSLKFCHLAEGRGDIYPRLGPTSEWDTAAAQAVLTAAGGAVLHAGTREPLTYNCADSLLNPWFIAVADRELPRLINLSHGV